MRLGPLAAGIAVAMALSASAGYAIQEFTLDEAQTRIERLEARVAALEEALESPDESAVQAKHSVMGTIVLVDEENFAADTPLNAKVGEFCVGYEGYSDIETGASVRAMDETGSIVGTGWLDSGEVIRVRPQVLGCEFPWTLEVEDADFYVFEIANRGGPSFSREDLEAVNWTVELSIGS